MSSSAHRFRRVAMFSPGDRVRVVKPVCDCCDILGHEGVIKGSLYTVLIRVQTGQEIYEIDPPHPDRIVYFREELELIQDPFEPGNWTELKEVWDPLKVNVECGPITGS